MLHSQALSIQKASSLCKEEITHQKIDSKMNTLWQWNSWSNITPQHVGELKSLKNKTHISPQWKSKSWFNICELAGRKHITPARLVNINLGDKNHWLKSSDVVRCSHAIFRIFTSSSQWSSEEVTTGCQEHLHHIFGVPWVIYMLSGVVTLVIRWHSSHYHLGSLVILAITWSYLLSTHTISTYN